MPSTPTGKRGFDDSDDPTMKAMVTETQQLRATCVAFILGKRSTVADTGASIDGFDRGDRSQHNLVRNNIMPGTGTERFQQLCSLEFLQRYFHTALANKVIKLGDPMKDVPKFKPPDQYAVPNDTQTMLNAGDLAKDTALAGVPPNVGAAISPVAKSKTRYQGIFCMDDGPFLRGKGVSQQVISGSTDKLKKPRMICATSATSAPSRRSASRWPTPALWTGRPTASCSPRATTTRATRRATPTWTRATASFSTFACKGQPSRPPGPRPRDGGAAGDKLFVVIGMDVWFEGGMARSSPTASGQGHDAKDDAPAKSARQAYEEARATEFRDNPVTGGPTTQGVAQKQYAAYKEGSATVLTNFRPMVATSSQMINYSTLKFDGKGNQQAGREIEANAFARVPDQSRMGLRLSHEGGEYIVGGWCIGNVLDTSASRAAFPGAGTNIGVRTAPNSSALNINVNISYWTATGCTATL